jgi:hypothetical protein
LVSGQVALIVGGELSNNSISSVEVYSPEGGCQYSLPGLPLPLLGLTVGLTNNFVVACSGYNTVTKLNNQRCWRYLFAQSAWQYSGNTLNSTKPNYPVQNYKNWLYFVNDRPGERIQYAPTYTEPWATKPPTPLGDGACSVMWRDNMIIFGGANASIVVQMFNFLTGNWSYMANMTYSRYSFGCTLLPDRNRVLVVSTVPGGDENRAVIFDPRTNVWSITGRTINARSGASLVTLGSRVFVIGGNSAPSPTSLSATVEEYDINTGTWSLVNTNLKGARTNFGVLALPATSFAHLANGCKGV